MSSYSDYANATSRIYEQEGAAQAELARQKGAIWGNALSNIGQIAAQAPARQLQQQQIGLQTEHLRQQGILTNLEVQKAQQQQQTQKALDSILANFGPDGAPDPEKIRQSFAGVPGGFQAWQTVTQLLAAQHKAALESDKEQADLEEKNRYIMADAGAQLKKMPDAIRPAALVNTIAQQQQLRRLTPAEANGFYARLRPDPSQPLSLEVTNQIVDELASASAKNVSERATAKKNTSEADKFTAELPGIQAKTNVEQQVAAGTVGGVTPEQQITNQRAAETLARQTTANAETARHNRVNEALSRARNQQGANATNDDAKAIADAIASGDQPPSVTGLYRFAGPVRAELARQGYDFTKANLDWEATKKHLMTLNGTQQNRLRQAISTASDSLGVIEDLAKQWDGGKFPILNKATLSAAKNGALGPKAQQIATNLTAQITDVTSELGNVYMGGNSPTDHALSLAQQNLSADWTRDQLLSAIKLARTNLAIRKNSILNSGAITTSGQQGPAAAPAGRIYYDANGNKVTR